MTVRDTLPAPTWGLRLLLLLLGLALPGCPGITHNPSQVPHLFPFGDIERTHAKPPGFAYFTNFDRHACTLQVVPLEATSPVQTQQVFIATILDEDGEPRRNRRVEWILEGVGNIMEVDESGFFPGRGYKVDNKYAVSYTDWLEHTISRGTGNPADDFVIKPGQSWCVVSSAVEGETKLTVYAPEIHNWDKSRLVVTTHWADCTWRLPPAVISRSGAQQVLTTEILRHGDRRPLPGYLVRYRIVDGPPAAFLTTRSAEAVATTDAGGKASVALSELELKPGVNHIAVEIIHASDPAAPGGSGAPIFKGETQVEWQAPQIGLSASAPPAVALGQEAKYSLIVANTGQVETQEVTLRAPIPEGLQYVRSEPAAIVDGNQLVWTLAGLPGGGTHNVQVVFRTLRPGQVAATAAVLTREGLHDERKAVTEVTVPKLDVQMSGPDTVMVNGPVAFQITVSNPGSGLATNVTLLDEFDAGLEHESRAGRLQKVIGTLAGGEKRTETVTLTARQPGKLVNRVKASADGGLTAKAEQAVAAQRGQLKIDVAGPAQRYVNKQTAWQITVSNTGELPLRNIAVKDLLPPELVFVSAGQGGALSGSSEVRWAIDLVPPGGKQVLELTTNCVRPAARALNAATAVAEAGLQVQSAAPIEITGLPAFRIDVKDTVDPVEVGGRTTYSIDIINRGTLAGSNVQITAVAPPQLKVMNTQGPTQPKIEGGKVVFPLLATLPVGAQIHYAVDVQAAQAGKVIFQVELRAATLREPVIAQESTTIIDSNRPGGGGTTREPPPAGAAPGGLPIPRQ